MRKLTKDQIIKACGVGSGIEKVLIGHGKYRHTINIFPETDYYDNVRQYLKTERAMLPDESKQHVDYITSHPTLVAEVSFPELFTSITDGLSPDRGNTIDYREGYYSALRDIKQKELNHATIK